MGEDWICSFLFETSFVFLRGFFWMLFPVFIILYIVFAIKAHYHYKNTLLKD